ncbi:zinc-binding dehydrogenase [Chromobacterium sp. IIBBL 290-4]|uniref:zinc-binding dehydrogenase n=1 Tax=Chromobacterium sp. IIBBL 290-4 TaxID=2953890 RepID=UPI0020B6E6E7|nr:zinc-binding dehydrogenase [Chromobacterium sp. IIBBL 290-4]UTH76438.1 zinc-binding dehydrogenase [Chromobacterium sp. IIBBL 290-4]
MQALQLVARERLTLVEQTLPPVVPAHCARLKMAYVTLNHLDLFGYRGMAFAKRTLPLTVGAEGVGRVVSVGTDSDLDLIGRAMAIYPSFFCGRCPACVKGRENLCSQSGGVMGFHRHGVAADFVDVPVSMLVPVPDGVELAHAACVPVTFATVYHMLVDNARLERGESILVQAGGSGIGSTAIRLARHLGASVFATVGSNDKAEKTRALGADHVINYRQQRFLREVRELTGKRGVDVVFEHVGADTWEESLLSLALGGRLVICGSTTGVEAKTNLMALFNQHIHVFGSFGAPLSGLEASMRLMRDGIEPVIDSILPLEDFERGLARLRRREVFGKIVIEMRPE